MTTSIKAKLNKLDRLTNFYKYRVIVFLYYRNEISFRNENKIMIRIYTKVADGPNLFGSAATPQPNFKVHGDFTGAYTRLTRGCRTPVLSLER